MCAQRRLISLGIRPVWSESLLSAWRKLESLATHWAHREDSDQTGWRPRLIWVLAGHTVILMDFCHEAAHVSKKLAHGKRVTGTIIKMISEGSGKPVLLYILTLVLAVCTINEPRRRFRWRASSQSTPNHFKSYRTFVRQTEFFCRTERKSAGQKLDVSLAQKPWD